MLQPGFVDLACKRGRNPRAAVCRHAFMSLTFAALLFTIAPPAVAAKVEIKGPADAMQLSAEDAPLSEVLAAMAARFNLTYEPAPELDRQVDGTYSGTVQQVLVRILDGYDYVTNFSSNGIELKVWGRSQTIPYSLPGGTPNPQPTANQVPAVPAPMRPAGIPGQAPLSAQAAAQ
jgi:hypothetical protein